MLISLRYVTYVTDRRSLSCHNGTSKNKGYIMTYNIGKIERIIRGAAGTAVITWGVMDQNWLGAVGVVLLGTATIGWCPPCALFGINTCCYKPFTQTA